MAACGGDESAVPELIAAIAEQSVAPGAAPRLLTVAEVAEILRVTTATVRTMCRERRLPGVLIRGQWRINRVALDALLGAK